MLETLVRENRLPSEGGGVMTAERRQAGLIQMVDQIDQKHDIAHKRLRESLIELKEQNENLTDSITLLKERVMSLEKTPVDMAKVRLTTGQTATLFIAVIGILGSSLGSWYAVTTKMDIEREANKTKWEYALRASDEQKRETAMLRIKVDEMTDKLNALAMRVTK